MCRRYIGLALVLFFDIAAVVMADPLPVTEPRWTLHLGGGADEHALGEGWSRPERAGPRRFRWITELEGDVWVELGRAEPLTFFMRASIPHLCWRRQRVALYVNNRYVTEWLAPDDHQMHPYTADIDGSHFREGQNRITLRMAYRTRIGRDSRKLALAVDYLELRQP